MKNRTFFIGAFLRIMILIISLPLFNSICVHGMNDRIRIISVGTVVNTDSIILQSPDVVCRGASPTLTVTGVNIRWYADSLKTVYLSKGNTYQARLLDLTTNFYLTQTIDGLESEITAIKIEVVEAFLLDVLTTPASCGKNDGTMTVLGKGGTERYPLKYKLNEGPLQLPGFFDNLAGETYQLTIQSEGCFGTSQVKIVQKPSPIISSIEQVDPKCGDTNGLVRIVAFAGTGALTYSLNGQDFSTSNLFDSLNSGEFTAWVMDDSLCKVSQSISLKTSKKLQLNQADIIPTSCGKFNGKVTLPSALGNGVLSYRITGRPAQYLNVFDSLEAGGYQVSAADQDGCKDTLNILIAESKGPKLVILKDVDQLVLWRMDSLLSL
jgi:hypothetical protein